MDGFFVKPGAVTRKPATKVAVTSSDQPKLSPKPVRSTTVHGSHKTRQADRSRTLMRHAVKKPTLATAHSKQPAKAEPKLPSNTVTARHERAFSTAKSASISRFSKHTPKVHKQVAHLPVQEAPATPTHHTARQAAAKAEPAPAHSVSFEDALHKATAHQQPKLHKSKLRERTARKLGTTTRLISAGSISLAVLLLVGFIAYQNVPNFAMRTAASRAGFAASMPGYTPSGFGMNGAIQASPGQVTVSFRSASDDRNYQVTQKPSNWTSESLLSNHVAVNNQSFQTYEDKGKTVYVSDGSTATWVNGGVWYEISGNSSLNTDQLLNIANSF